VIATVDTFSPIKSFSNILDYYASGKNDFLGYSVWTNEISSLVPRFFWSEKPIQVINAGNYYTQEIINYERAVTISPTLLGSSYIVAGNFGILLTALISGILFKWLDVKFYIANRHVSNTTAWDNNHISYSVFYYFILFYTFAAAREGLEVFIQRFIVSYILFLFVVITAKYGRKLVIGACGKMPC
jgi:antigen polymerase